MNPKEVIAAVIPNYNGCSRDAISDAILAALDAAGLVVVPRGAHDALVAALKTAKRTLNSSVVWDNGRHAVHVYKEIDAALAAARK